MHQATRLALEEAEEAEGGVRRCEAIAEERSDPPSVAEERPDVNRRHLPRRRFPAPPPDPVAIGGGGKSRIYAGSVTGTDDSPPKLLNAIEIGVILIRVMGTYGRKGERVDGPNVSDVTAHALDRWERRLEDLFAGRLYDMLDATLYDTITKFLIDIQGQTAESSTSTSGSESVLCSLLFKTWLAHSVHVEVDVRLVIEDLVSSIIFFVAVE